MELIRGWLRQGERCGIVTLHDPMLALNFCDELLLLSGGKLTGRVRPGEDGLDKMEAMLEAIYGRVSLLRCKTQTGPEQLVMLKEGDP